MCEHEDKRKTLIEETKTGMEEKDTNKFTVPILTKFPFS